MRTPIRFVAAALIVCSLGCTTTVVERDARRPEIVIEASGIITFHGRQLQPGKIASALKSAGYKKNEEVILLIPDKPDQTLMRKIAGELLANGYNRPPLFVKQRKATTTLGKPQ